MLVIGLLNFLLNKEPNLLELHKLMEASIIKKELILINLINLKISIKALVNTLVAKATQINKQFIRKRTLINNIEIYLFQQHLKRQLIYQMPINFLQN
jgi:hypothetical protein